MTKDKVSDKLSVTDSEAASYRVQQVNKISAIIYPTVCALLLVSLFGGSFIATRIIYDKYDVWNSKGYRFDVTKLQILPLNLTFIRPYHPVPDSGKLQMMNKPR